MNYQRATTPTAKPGGRWAAIALLPAIPLLAFGLYQEIGASKLIPILQTSADTSKPLPAASDKEMPSVDEMVARLAARLEQAPAEAGKTLSVQISLDPSLKDQAAPEDTLFVFARAAQGPRMPLAIVRKQVKDLPLTVTLDDSLAMTPAAKLSNFSQVVVSARISKSGNAMPQSGDLNGTSEAVAPGHAETIVVTINGVTP